MVRDLVDAAINMVRTEREDEVYPQAEQRADERLLDLLLPPPPPPSPAEKTERADKTEKAQRVRGRVERAGQGGEAGAARGRAPRALAREAPRRC